MIRCLALLALLAAPVVQAQAPLHDDLPLRYLEQADNPAPHQPLVIFLHGYGSNEEDLFGLREGLPRGYNYLSVRAPLTLEEGSYQWFRRKGDGPYDGVTEDLADSTRVLGSFVEKAAAKYHTTADKVFLVGFSQGAMMSYQLALRQPQAVRGIAALSGKVLPVLRAELKPRPALTQLAIFIGHGTNDSLVPYSDGVEANSLLRALGLQPQWQVYPGMGHGINAAEVQDLGRWLQALNP